MEISAGLSLSLSPTGLYEKLIFLNSCVKSRKSTGEDQLLGKVPLFNILPIM